ncbi:hypothetical protein CPB86DRAFT_700609, partial [Serendipita vermifera]
VGCLHCLVSWFSMAHARDDTPDLVSRPKTCPQCRVVVTNRPTPSFTLRNLIEELQSVGVIERHPESSTESNNDPWAGIFADIPSIQQPEQHVGPQVEELYQLEEYVGVHDPDANDDVLSIDSPSESSEYRLEFEARREHLDQVMDWEIEVRNENTRGWTSPQWEPPRFSSGTVEVTGDDVARLDRTRMEITSLLNRGATKEMIARYRLSYGHGYGIIMEKGSLYIQLGWNISRNAGDLEGRIYVGHVLYEMRNHPERYAFSEPDRLGIRDVLRLVPILTEESSLNRGDLIEIQGPSGSGKTELLYFIAMTTIFPQEFNIPSISSLVPPQETKSVRLGGRDSSVVVCDCDGRWSMTRLYHIMETLLYQRFQETYPELDPNTPRIAPELQGMILKCMGHLHLFQPTSITSLVATLLNLKKYHFTKMEDEQLCMLMIDGGLSSFYWQDRWVSESLSVNSKELPPSTTAAFVKALQGIRESHNPVVLITNWAISSLPNTSFFRQHLPPPYPAVSDNQTERSQVSRVSPIQITHHITLCDPHQSPASDNGQLPEELPYPANQSSRDTPLTIQGIMRTPPRDLPDQVVTHFSFLLADYGVTVMPNREQEDVVPIEELMSRSME